MWSPTLIDPLVWALLLSNEDITICSLSGGSSAESIVIPNDPSKPFLKDAATISTVEISLCLKTGESSKLSKLST